MVLGWMHDLTWTCHVCGAERPDAKVSVFSTEHEFGDGVLLTVNVRYCNDRPYCVAGARDVDFGLTLPPKEP